MNLGDGKLKLLGTGLAALWLTLGWQGAPADAITVTPANPTIGVGQTQQFTANGALTPTAVAAGGSHTCMRLPDGTVQCWGRNYSGQLGNGDGNLTNSSVPVTARGLTTATSVVTGDAHTCALLGDGTVQCWGVGDAGQLGDGTVADPATGPPGSSTPVQVSGITGAAAVIAGGYHTCALFADGTAWCWGRSDDGQLGNGARASASTPVPVTNLTGVTAMTAGFYHTCALLPNGTVWCWGRNDEGQLGDGTTVGRPAPVQAGITGALAVSGGYH